MPATMRDLLLRDFKQARDADLDTIYALVDAWTAYIETLEKVSI